MPPRSRWCAARTSPTRSRATRSATGCQGTAATTRSTAARATTSCPAARARTPSCSRASRGKFSPAINSGFDRITDFDRAEGDRIDLTRPQGGDRLRRPARRGEPVRHRHAPAARRRHDRARGRHDQRALGDMLPVLSGAAGRSRRAGIACVALHQGPVRTIPSVPPLTPSDGSGLTPASSGRPQISRALCQVLESPMSSRRRKARFRRAASSVGASPWRSPRP